MAVNGMDAPMAGRKRVNDASNKGYMLGLQASERIPLSLCGIHCSISILTWVAVAGLKGDYQLQVADTWFGGQRQAMFTAICSGAMTWVRPLESPLQSSMEPKMLS